MRCRDFNETARIHELCVVAREISYTCDFSGMRNIWNRAESLECRPCMIIVHCSQFIWRCVAILFLVNYGAQWKTRRNGRIFRGVTHCESRDRKNALWATEEMGDSRSAHESASQKAPTQTVTLRHNQRVLCSQKCIGKTDCEAPHIVQTSRLAVQLQPPGEPSAVDAKGEHSWSVPHRIGTQVERSKRLTSFGHRRHDDRIQLHASARRRSGTAPQNL